MNKMKIFSVSLLFRGGCFTFFAKAIKSSFCLGLMGLIGLSSGLAQPDFTQDEAGETELHRAVRALMIAPNGPYTIPEACANVLREGAAGINIQNKRGRTPLHLFVMYCNSQNDGMELFVELGADVTIIDDLGLTPLDYILLKYGVDLRLKALLSSESAKEHCLSLLMEVDYAEGEENNPLIAAQHLLRVMLERMKANYERPEAMNGSGILFDMTVSTIDSFLHYMQDAINGPMIDVEPKIRRNSDYKKQFAIYVLQQKIKVLEEVIASWMPSRAKSARNAATDPSQEEDAYELQGNEVSHGEGWGEALLLPSDEGVITFERILAGAQNSATRAILVAFMYAVRDINSGSL